MRRILFVLLLSGGCAAPRTAQRAERTGADTAELRAQMRRDRRHMRSLENELALLRARMSDTPVSSTPPPAAPRADVAPQGAPPEGEQPLAETLGQSQDDAEVEVVYEGEAAEATPERPRLELRESSRSYRGAGPVDERLAATDDLADGSLADAGRLPVLAGEIPTVDAQLRRARVAHPPAADHRRQSAGVTNPTWSASPADHRRQSAGVTDPTRSASPGDHRRQSAGVTNPTWSASPRAPLPTSTDPLEEYQRYVTALRGGNHEYASLGLRAFLDRNPKHDLADNAQYWLAESYYDRKQFPLALIEFQKVIDRYPSGNKKPDAMLKVAFCQLMRGKLPEGRAALQRVITSFPDSSPAALARAKLEELARK